MNRRRHPWKLAMALVVAAGWATPLAARSPSTARYSGCVRLADGRQLQYAEFGAADGPLVLFFHGTPGTRHEAGLIAEELATARVRLVAVNRPGIGCSTPANNRRIVDWPCDAAQLAAALGGPETRFGIIGLSGGAPYALACARAMPDRLTHVAVVSGHTPLTAPCVEPGNQDRLIELVGNAPRLGKLGLALQVRQLDRQPAKAVLKLTKRWSEADRQLVLGNPVLKRRLIANLEEASACGVDGIVQDIALLGGCWGFSVSEAQGVPISIWQGGCDPIVTPSMGRYFHRQLAGSRLHIDPRAGHVTMFKWHAEEILASF